MRERWQNFKELTRFFFRSSFAQCKRSIHATCIPVTKLVTLLFLIVIPASAQVNYGELRLRVADASGTGVAASIELSNTGNGYYKTVTSNPSGFIAVQHMPYGVYRVGINKPGFAPFSTMVEVRSALPVAKSIQLNLASVVTKVNVTAASTLVDPDNPSSVMQIGAKQIEQRLSSLPGRS